MKTTRIIDRVKKGPKSRNYLLASFFDDVLYLLTDPKDGKALVIKTDPAYAVLTNWNRRKDI